ncbi:MAG: PEP-CTERM sorting domain-containing protein [Opitutaceae bacterium]
MKKATLLFTSIAITTMAMTTANAAVILQYDSVAPSSTFGAFTYGSNTELSEIQQNTDNAFVTAANDTSAVGPKGIMAAVHGSQTNVQGAFGNQNDLMYRFGSSSTTAGNGVLGGTMSAGHIASGPYITFTYTAAQDQNLEEFSFHLFNNSGGGSSYGARDVGLTVSVDGGAHALFGTPDTSATGNGNQGTIVFSDSVLVGAGDVVIMRLGFTDRTRTNNDLQAATRIGDVQISAVPEPGTFALLSGLFALSSVALRRRKA